MKGVVQFVPNVAFERELLIDLGGRPVEVRFLGRGNTGGDTIVYLPRERSWRRVTCSSIRCRTSSVDSRSTIP